jgi:hypothetical protein
MRHGDGLRDSPDAEQLLADFRALRRTVGFRDFGISGFQARPLAALQRPAPPAVSRLLLLAALSIVSMRAEAAEPLAVPADGKPFPATLQSVADDWSMAFDDAGTQRVVAAADLVRWGAWTEPAGGPLVILGDGGLLVADVFKADKDVLVADSLLFGALRLPLDALAGVVFQLPAERRRRDLLADRLLGARGNQDRVILDNGDELPGVLESIVDDVLGFRGELGRLDIETHRVAALVLNPALRRRPAADGLRVWTGLSDGSRILAARLAGDAEAVKLTPALLDEPWQTRLERLVALQPLGGRAVYLSDLEPAEYRHVPYLSLPWPYHRDRNVLGGRLRAGGRLSVKGLGVHSAARLTYALDGSARRFESELAIDDCAEGGGSVRFRVFLDGREAFTSGPVRGGDEPLPVSVDLQGARRLDLVVDFAERAGELDRADWLDARLVR